MDAASAVREAKRMSEARQFQHIGQRTIRPDGFDKVTGRANYGADF